VDLRKALLDAIPPDLVAEWFHYRGMESMPFAREYTNRVFDYETMALGILNRAIGMVPSDTAARRALENARVRVYPGFHNTGSTQCLACMDTGIVCASCLATPCERNCERKDLKTANIELCAQEDCEAADYRDLEHAKTKLALYRQAETIASLKAQLAAKDEQIKELEMGVARST
jgi:hypothetical protein